MAAGVGVVLLAGTALLAALVPDLPAVLAPGREPERLVLVGVPGLALDEGDRTVLDGRPAVVGTLTTDTAVSTGGCAADGWASLGAGEAATTGGRCAIAVTPAGVRDWRDLSVAAAVHGTELGRLGSAGRCVTAVGSAAALGAARPDGTVAELLPVQDWVSAGYATSCPVTLVDGDQLSGADRGAAVTALADEPGTQVWVVGLGPGPLRSDSAPRPAYLVGTGVADGALTGPDGRPAGVTDLADSLHVVVAGDGSTAGADGPVGLAVQAGPVDAATLEQQVVQQGDLGRRGGVWAGLLVVVLAAVVAALLVRGSRWRALLRPWLLPVLAAVPARLQLTSLTQWWRIPSAPLAVAGVVLTAALVAGAARRASRVLGAPATRLAALFSAGVLLAGVLTGQLLSGGLLATLPGRHPPVLPWPSLVAAAGLAVVVAVDLLLRRRGRRETAAAR